MQEVSTVVGDSKIITLYTHLTHLFSVNVLLYKGTSINLWKSGIKNVSLFGGQKFRNSCRVF